VRQFSHPELFRAQEQLWAIRFQYPAALHLEHHLRITFRPREEVPEKRSAVLVLGNWEANYVFLAYSGAPYNLVVNGDIANISGNRGTASGYGRPNLVGDPMSPCTVNGRTVPAGSQACFFNPAAFAAPIGSFGNFGRDVLRNEPFFNLDFSLLKNIPFGERRSIQLRFDHSIPSTSRSWVHPVQRSSIKMPVSCRA
jgi:hypothetical protein